MENSSLPHANDERNALSSERGVGGGNIGGAAISRGGVAKGQAHRRDRRGIAAEASKKRGTLSGAQVSAATLKCRKSSFLKGKRASWRQHGVRWRPQVNGAKRGGR